MNKFDAKFKLGQIDGIDQQDLPPNALYKAKNCEYVKDILTRRTEPTMSILSLMELIKDYNAEKFWIWYPSNMPSNAQSDYILVFYADYKLYIAYSILGTAPYVEDVTPTNITYNSSSNLVGKKDGAFFKVVDGVNKPHYIYIDKDGNITSSQMGLPAPTEYPTIQDNDRQYTEDYYNEVTSDAHVDYVGYVRIAYTYKDDFGNESNPSPVSSWAYLDFNKIDKDTQEKARWIDTLYYDNLTLPEDLGESTKKNINTFVIYREIMYVCDDGTPKLLREVDEFDIVDKTNPNSIIDTIETNTLSNIISYDNDVAPVGRKIETLNNVTFFADINSPTLLPYQFDNIWQLTISNINAETKLDACMFIRLYDEESGHNDAISGLNWNDDYAELVASPEKFRIYDNDFNTALPVCFLTYTLDDHYLDILISVPQLNSGETRLLYFAFLGEGVTKNYDTRIESFKEGSWCNYSLYFNQQQAIKINKRFGNNDIVISDDYTDENIESFGYTGKGSSTPNVIYTNKANTNNCGSDQQVVEGDIITRITTNGSAFYWNNEVKTIPYANGINFNHGSYPGRFNSLRYTLNNEVDSIAFPDTGFFTIDIDLPNISDFMKTTAEIRFLSDNFYFSSISIDERKVFLPYSKIKFLDGTNAGVYNIGSVIDDGVQINESFTPDKETVSYYEEAPRILFGIGKNTGVSRYIGLYTKYNVDLDVIEYYLKVGDKRIQLTNITVQPIENAKATIGITWDLTNNRFGAFVYIKDNSLSEDNMYHFDEVLDYDDSYFETIERIVVGRYWDWDTIAELSLDATYNNIRFVPDVYLSDIDEIRQIVNYLPHWSNDYIGWDGTENKHITFADAEFSTARQNNKIVWTPENGLNVPTGNEKFISEPVKAIIYAPSFLQFKYESSLLAFTRNTITRLIIAGTSDTWGSATDNLVKEYDQYGLIAPRALLMFRNSLYFMTEIGLAKWNSTEMRIVSNMIKDGVEVPRIVLPIKENLQLIPVSIGTRKQILLHDLDTNEAWCYDENGDRWTYFTNLDVVEYDVLSGGEQTDNLVYFLASDNNIYEYPSNTYTEETCEVETSDFPLTGAILRKVRTEHDGDIEIKVVKKNKFGESEYMVSSIGNMTPTSVPLGIWGDMVNFTISGFNELKNFSYYLTRRGL